MGYDYHVNVKGMTDQGNPASIQEMVQKIETTLDVRIESSTHEDRFSIKWEDRNVDEEEIQDLMEHICLDYRVNMQVWYSDSFGTETDFFAGKNKEARLAEKHVIKLIATSEVLIEVKDFVGKLGKANIEAVIERFIDAFGVFPEKLYKVLWVEEGLNHSRTFGTLKAAKQWGAEKSPGEGSWREEEEGWYEYWTRQGIRTASVKEIIIL